MKVVVVDTMTFSYLRGLDRLDLLWAVATATKAIAVTASVLKQVHRSGALGQLVESYVSRGEVTRISVKVGDPISSEVARVLKGNDSRLVARNRVDVELIEVAHAMDGVVLTRENGIHKLAERRRVATIDLVGFFAWSISLGLVQVEDVGRIVAPWATDAADGTGCPSDFGASFVNTLERRGGINAVVAGLPGRRGT